MEAARSVHLAGLLTLENIAALVQPYVAGTPGNWPQIHAQLAAYLDLVLKWNAKLNLTAIRTPEEIVQRHFGESLFAGAHLGDCRTLLDFGSGAGFPGLPIQILRPDIAVTLAESQGKKAAFLREAIRTLGLSTEVYAGRVEAMPSETQFDTVTLRAVDNMQAAVREAGKRAAKQVLILGSRSSRLSAILEEDFEVGGQLSIPEAIEGTLEILVRR